MLAGASGDGPGAAGAAAMSGGIPGMGPPSVAPAWWWWLLVGLATALLLWLVPRIDIALQLDLSIIFILALLALSMSFLWGYVGILSFGQTAFFGLGGYAYAVLALNFDDHHLAGARRAPPADGCSPPCSATS